MTQDRPIQGCRLEPILPRSSYRGRLGASLSRTSLHITDAALAAVGRPKRVRVWTDNVARVIVIAPAGADDPASFAVHRDGTLATTSVLQALQERGFTCGRYTVTVVDGKQLHLRRRDA